MLAQGGIFKSRLGHDLLFEVLQGSAHVAPPMTPSHLFGLRISQRKYRYGLSADFRPIAPFLGSRGRCI